MKERRGEHPLGDAVQLVMLAVFSVAWVTDSFVLHRSTFLKGRVPRALRMELLGLTVAAALLLLLPAHEVVAEPRPDQVVDNGPFRYVRHPLYLAALLGYLGTAISTLSLVCLALLAPIFAVYDYLASYEEQLLEERFGDAYRDYKARTGKWLPGIGIGASKRRMGVSG